MAAPTQAPAASEPSTSQAPTETPAPETATESGVSADDEMARQEEIQRKVAETREKIEQVRSRGPNTTSYPYDVVLIRPRIFEKGRMSYQVVLV